MTSVAKEDVWHLAKLAHLKLSADEVGLYQKELATILTFINQLQALDVEHLKPTAQVTNLKSVTRADRVVPELKLSQADLKNSGLQIKDNQIKIDKVVF